MSKLNICILICVMQNLAWTQSLKTLSIQEAYPIIEKSAHANFFDLKTSEVKNGDHKANIKLINSESNFISTYSPKAEFNSIFRTTNSIDLARKTCDSLKKEFLALFSDFNFTQIETTSLALTGYEKFVMTKKTDDYWWFTGVSIYLNSFFENEKKYKIILKFDSKLEGAVFEQIRVPASGDVISNELKQLISEASTGFKNIRGEEIDDLSGIGSNFVATTCLTGLQGCWISVLNRKATLNSYVLVAESTETFLSGYNSMLYSFANSLGSEYYISRTKDDTGFNFVPKNKLDNNYFPLLKFEKVEQDGKIALLMKIFEPYKF